MAEATCPYCGGLNDPKNKHCAHCGRAVDRWTDDRAGIAGGNAYAAKGDVGVDRSSTSIDGSTHAHLESHDNSVRNDNRRWHRQVEFHDSSSHTDRGQHVGNMGDGNTVIVNPPAPDAPPRPCPICGENLRGQTSYRCPQCKREVCTVHATTSASRCEECRRARSRRLLVSLLGAVAFVVVAAALIWSGIRLPQTVTDSGTPTVAGGLPRQEVRTPLTDADSVGRDQPRGETGGAPSTPGRQAEPGVAGAASPPRPPSRTAENSVPTTAAGAGAISFRAADFFNEGTGSGPVVFIIGPGGSVESDAMDLIASTVGGTSRGFKPVFARSRLFEDALSGDVSPMKQLGVAGRMIVLGRASEKIAPQEVAGQAMFRAEITVSATVFTADGNSDGFTVSAVGAGFAEDDARKNATDAIAAKVGERLRTYK